VYSGNTLLTSVVLPDCRGPTNAMTGNLLAISWIFAAAERLIMEVNLVKFMQKRNIFYVKTEFIVCRNRILPYVNMEFTVCKNGIWTLIHFVPACQKRCAVG
jgi:hypothetical protein